MVRAGVVLGIAVCFWGATAPAEDCAQVLSPGDARRAAAQEASGAYRLPDGPAGETTWIVPLTFHIVRRSDGTEGISEAQLTQAILDANAAFAPLDIAFCEALPRFIIDSDEFYLNLNTSFEIDQLRRLDPIAGTINCYFTENLIIGATTFCGLSSFTFSDVQGIVMRNGCTGVATDPSSFPHELGHYFDLFHTHERQFGDECVNGSNCSTAGDQLCDTPADPQLDAMTVSPACLYTGAERDNCTNALYHPSTRNFMSYSLKLCRDRFTAQQIAKARATLLNLRPGLAREVCPPPCGDWIRCDANCDGHVDNFDIDAFVQVLLDVRQYYALYPNCHRLCNDDINGDQRVDNFDVDAFVDCLSQ